MTTAYTGILFSNKIVPKVALPYKDLETFIECLERQECTLVTFTKSISYLQQLTPPGSSLETRFNASLKVNPIKIVPVAHTNAKILEEQRKYLVAVGPKSYFLNTIEGNKNCQFYLTDFHNSEFNAFPVRKNLSSFDLLNTAAIQMQEFGLAVASKRKYYRRDRCDNSFVSASFKQVGLNGFVANALFFYAIGLLTAGIVFLCELFICTSVTCWFISISCKSVHE